MQYINGGNNLNKSTKWNTFWIALCTLNILFVLKNTYNLWFHDITFSKGISTTYGMGFLLLTLMLLVSEIDRRKKNKVK